MSNLYKETVSFQHVYELTKTCETKKIFTKPRSEEIFLRHETTNYNSTVNLFSFWSNINYFQSKEETNFVWYKITMYSYQYVQADKEASYYFKKYR